MVNNLAILKSCITTSIAAFLKLLIAIKEIQAIKKSSILALKKPPEGGEEPISFENLYDFNPSLDQGIS